MNYRVFVEAKETYSGEVIVKADSEQQARQKVMSMTQSCSVDDLGIHYDSVEWFVDGVLVVPNLDHSELEGEQDSDN